MSLAHAFFSKLKSGEDVANVAPAPHQSPPTTSASSSWNERFYHVAVQGCCHGELDRIYAACADHERATGKKIDLLLCCGDFQSIRTPAELASMAVPDKYKVMGDFCHYCDGENEKGHDQSGGHRPSSSYGENQYRSGPGGASSSSPNRVAPYLTIFVGGNHENSDLLAQESYGGFVAPNIYYLGHSGVVSVDGVVTVAGLSGIFKAGDVNRPYPPRPYAHREDWKRGAYHVRQIEMEKLHTYVSRTSCASSPSSPRIDLFLSHDWPVGITDYGDVEQLLRYKPFFRADIEKGELGNPRTMQLLRAAQPTYWLAAHLHCFFEATVKHPPRSSSSPAVHEGSPSESAASAETNFIALDKCAKGKGFLTFVDLPLHGKTRSAGTDTAAERITRDAEWLRILAATHDRLAQNDCSDPVDALAERIGPLSVATVSAAAKAPTTATLLSALGIAPALPLQQEVALSGAATQTGRRSSPPYQRPRVDREAPVAAAPPPALSFFEDVSGGDKKEPQRAEAVPAPPPAGKSTLSWFEDV